MKLANFRIPWRLYLMALLIVAIATAIRIVFFVDLGRNTAYLTYYPAIVLAALYGGLHAGFLTALVSALLCFYWIQEGSMSSVETLAMGVFLISCLMISGIAEAMRRAQTRVQQEKEKAEAANKAKSIFLASMSHELRTPLNAILGFTEMMRNDGRLPEVQRQKNLEIIHHSGEHLLALINDVLDMAKIDAGNMHVQNASFDLGAMLRETIDLLRLRAQDKGLQLVLDQSSRFPRFVNTDEAKLRQSLINLVGNAIKFSEHGDITLRLNAAPGATAQQQLLVIEVQDSGIGIAAVDQVKLFQPFTQVGSNTRQQQGTGLGLAITHRFVELMGGRISVQSESGQGSIFRVELPVERAQSAQSETPRSPSSGRLLHLAPGQIEYRILIVDDQVENQMLLRQLLEPVGFTVRVAENGRTAVELFQSWQPHFIWMDIRMPELDGIAATREIRALSGGCQVKIVALTASVFRQEQDSVMAAGLDDLVRKPYRPQEIYDCLARHLGVSYVHASTPATAVEHAHNTALQPKALASLPEALRAELGAALVSLDSALIMELTDRIALQNPLLGEVLAEHADQFNYTAILQALHADAEDSNGKALA